MKTRKIIPAIITLIAILFFSCTKDRMGAAMMVKMTDGSAVTFTTHADAYQAVNVEITGVEINYEGTTDAWVALPVHAGIYNLIDIQNDITTVLADHSSIRAGKVSQMRMILGDHNTLVTGNGTFDLKVPSGAETGLKINLDTEIKPGKTVTITIDFNSEKSVVDEGNNSFLLKPYLELKAVDQY